MIIEVLDYLLAEVNSWFLLLFNYLPINGVATVVLFNMKSKTIIMYRVYLILIFTSFIVCLNLFVNNKLDLSLKFK